MKQMTRSFLAAFALSLLGLAMLVMPARAQTSVAEPTPAEIATLASSALNAVTTMQGRFLQIDHYGNEVRGDIYLARPGRVRFEYDEPSPLLIVSDGATVTHRDLELDTFQRAPLRRTPLHPILKSDVDLAEDLALTEVYISNGLAFLTARDESGEMEGAVTLVFDARTYDLLGWRVEDGLGQMTRVRLEDVQRNVQIADSQFILREPRRRR